MDGPTQAALDHMRVASLEELTTLSTREMAERLGGAPFPASEKVIGAVVLVAVDRLKDATTNLLESSRSLEEKTGRLVTAGWLALVVAGASLMIALVALIK